MKKKHYLTKVQEQAVRMIFEGGKHRAVAEELSISEATLSNWKKSAWWGEAMADYESRCREVPAQMITSYKSYAAQTLVYLLKSKNERIRLKAAQTILNFPA